MLREWLKLAIAASALKHVDLARLLSDAIGRSVDPTAITKMLTGDRRISGDELIELARICDYPLPSTISEEGLADFMGAPVHSVRVFANFSFLVVSTDELHKQICYSLIKSGKIERTEDLDAIALDIVSSLTKAATTHKSASRASRLVERVQDVVDRQLDASGLSKDSIVP